MTDKISNGREAAAPPGRGVRVGILGGGQLARMLALSGYPLGARFATLDPAPDACAAAVSRHIVGEYDDRSKLEHLSGMADVVTYEFENIPEESAAYFAWNMPVYPPLRALAVSQDRLKEKTLFRELGIPTPEFRPVDSLDDLKAAAQEVGLPAVLKSRTMGYDGKGQTLVKSTDCIEDAWKQVGGPERILEAFVPFTREISVIAARSAAGDVKYYPVGENTHRKGILHHSVIVNGDSDPMQKSAEDYSERLLNYFGYVGVLALELFDVGGMLVANEIAPRVHNTGHWTIDGAVTSQFENHIRAITGLPLGDASAIGFSAMVNFIGAMPDAEAVLKINGAHLHDYGKEAKPGRKLGHCTVHGDTKDEVIAGMHELLKISDGA